MPNKREKQSNVGKFKNKKNVDGSAINDENIINKVYARKKPSLTNNINEVKKFVSSELDKSIENTKDNKSILYLERDQLINKDKDEGVGNKLTNIIDLKKMIREIVVEELEKKGL